MKEFNQKTIENLSFEEAYNGLESAVEALRNDAITLDDSMKQFEKGMAYYEQCASLLEEAKGKVELYSKETNSLEAFES